LNQEIKRRTHAVWVFPNAQSCLRLVRTLAAGTHEECMEGTRCLNMEFLRERRREQLRVATEAG
jgi:transposase-like protein